MLFGLYAWSVTCGSDAFDVDALDDDVLDGLVAAVGRHGLDRVDDRAGLVVGDLTVPAGSLLEITLSSPTGGSVQATVPVVAPQFEYSTVTPTAN